MQNHDSPDISLPVGQPLIVDDPESAHWDQCCELLVVGLGAAGASAAIHARQAGVDVLVLDRFGMGGATAKSGGVVYAGGGTKQQIRLGIEDTPEAMFQYLSMEVGDAVSENSLRRFCDESRSQIEWLESLGVRFDSEAPPPKTSYPKNGIYLYYSGNESVKPFCDAAPPAPRGHRTVCKGLSGKRLFSYLQKRVDALGIPVLKQTAARQLVQDASGRIIGVKAWQLTPGSAAAEKHEKLIRRADWMHNGLPALADKLRARATAIEYSEARPVMIRATRSVILTTGGFIFNQPMVAENAPNYRHNMRLGTTACDGSGIRLGLSVGAAVDRMHKASAWRFINPPQSFTQGIVVNTEGKRFCNEASYGARLGVAMCDEQNGKAWMIVDKLIRRKALREALFGGIWGFQSVPAIFMMLFAKRSASIIGLAHKLGLPPETLNATLHAYNHIALSGGTDGLGKTSEQMQRLTGPFYAVDISASGNPMAPCPTITLGGLRVDESNSAVLNQEGEAIPGLYAAGRAAVGIASNGYVSGLSIADCLWSGKRAGLAAADNHEQPNLISKTA